MVPTKKDKKGTFGLTAGHGVVMSPWFALLESVAVALPKALLALRLREEKRHGWVDVCMGYLIFSSPGRTKLTKSIHCAGETQFLTLESHACQSK